MLLNFCDASLRTDVTCSTISTEGYEVDNLVNNSCKGFLAYSCIKPPVHIDFVFICNIQIHNVILWPQVGAQKSSGFQLSVKSSTDSSIDFVNVSSVYLQKDDNGVCFYRRDLVNNQQEMSVPPKFNRRYIKHLNVNNYVNVLRINITKTDNSVPAVGRIEIWGKVSTKCGKDIIANVMSLWTNRFNKNLDSSNESSPSSNTYKTVQEEKSQNLLLTDALNVPEEFLDPITFEIMTQPIILPSGKTIDQKTLDKHGQNEAIWGRPMTDPFTGIPFSDNRKPVMATSLKSQIDQFLLENCNDEEIKKMPRVLGRKNIFARNTQLSVSTVTNRPSSSCQKNVKRKSCFEQKLSSAVAKKPLYAHSLPIASLSNKKDNLLLKNNNKPALLGSKVSDSKATKVIEVNELEVQFVSEQSKCTHSECDITLNPCRENILYKLPCSHIICRKTLLSMKNYKCPKCSVDFKSCDPQRIHV